MITALVHEPESSQWLAFATPEQIISCQQPGDVANALKRIEAAVEADGLHAVGFVSYEAAPAFEPTAAVHADADFPLLWFALCPPPQVTKLPPLPGNIPRPDWSPQCSRADFAADIAAIHAAIAAGETYQVNHSFFLKTGFHQDAWPFFLQLAHGAHGGYAAWVDTGRYAICSASPELFFSRSNGEVICRPMKGTAPRGLTRADDLQRVEALKASTKERAENIMVLDMIRNDLARLPGGPVEVPACCEVEQYPTVWQMTSTASTRSEASLAEIFSALFPCASITGAPKLQTMRHIARIEGRPRRLYTGAIGHIAPKGKATFSVAIRTAVIDRQEETAEYGIGAGITWDSVADAEYDECLNKARALTAEPTDFSLLESLLYEPDNGLLLLDAHLQRLQASADYFDYPCDEAALRRRLADKIGALPPQPHKLRLLIDHHGATTVEAEPLAVTTNPEPLQVRLARQPIDSNDPFLYHKTTRRDVYNQARAAVDDCDEVLLYNQQGEITEASNFNLVAQIDGRLWTPPVACGLLAGTFRGDLIAKGEIEERVIRVEELAGCERLVLVNSVRRWREAVLVE